MKPIVIIGIIIGVGVFVAVLASGSLIPVQTVRSEIETNSALCSGNARCITGKVTDIVDGDTIKVNGKSIRFALSSADEFYERDGKKATKLIAEICPVGSSATVDEDDGQLNGSYGRILGVIYCNGMNLNSELLDSGLGFVITDFCDTSEFGGTKWAQKHGC